YSISSFATSHSTFRSIINLTAASNRFFAEATLCDSEKHVAAVEHRHPMRNDKRRSLKHESFHRINDRGLGFKVDRTRRLVENKYGRVLQKSTRKGNALSLPTCKTHASFTDNALVTLG